MLSLSTCWNSHRYQDGLDIARAMRKDLPELRILVLSAGWSVGRHGDTGGQQADNGGDCKCG